jgi:hypothetical protein
MDRVCGVICRGGIVCVCVWRSQVLAHPWVLNGQVKPRLAPAISPSVSPTPTVAKLAAINEQDDTFTRSPKHHRTDSAGSAGSNHSMGSNHSAASSNHSMGSVRSVASFSSTFTSTSELSSRGSQSSSDAFSLTSRGASPASILTSSSRTPSPLVLDPSSRSRSASESPLPGQLPIKRKLPPVPDFESADADMRLAREESESPLPLHRLQIKTSRSPVRVPDTLQESEHEAPTAAPTAAPEEDVESPRATLKVPAGPPSAFVVPAWLSSPASPEIGPDVVLASSGPAVAAPNAVPAWQNFSFASPPELTSPEKAVEMKRESVSPVPEVLSAGNPLNFFMNCRNPYKWS